MSKVPRTVPTRPDAPASGNSSGPGSAAPTTAQTPHPRRRNAVLAGIALALVLIVGTIVLVTHSSSGSSPTASSSHSPASQSPTPTPTPAQSTTAPQPTASPSTAPATSSGNSGNSGANSTVTATASAPSGSVASQLTNTIIDYYQLMPGNTAAGWTWLTPDYQQNHADGEANYDAFWAAIQSVSLTDVEATPPSTVVATIHYVDKNGSTATERTSFGLVQENGTWKIASSAVLSHQGG